MAISTSPQFYLDRAKRARSEAEEATPFHLRERCRRSEAAWSSLAQKPTITAPDPIAFAAAAKALG